MESKSIFRLLYTMMSIMLNAEGLSISKNDKKPYGSYKKVVANNYTFKTIWYSIDTWTIWYSMETGANSNQYRYGLVGSWWHMSNVTHPIGHSNVIMQHMTLEQK